MRMVTLPSKLTSWFDDLQIDLFERRGAELVYNREIDNLTDQLEHIEWWRSNNLDVTKLDQDVRSFLTVETDHIRCLIKETQTHLGMLRGTDQITMKRFSPSRKRFAINVAKNLKKMRGW